MIIRKGLIIYLLSFITTSIIYCQNIEISHGPYLQSVTETEVTIVWTTNSNAVSWVEIADGNIESFYGKEHVKHYQTSHGKRVIGKLHRVKITGLSPGKDYKYRVYSQAVLSNNLDNILFGTIASTNVYKKDPLRFSTLNPNKQSLSAYIVNDIHGKVDNLRAMLEDVSFENTDCVVFNGDMISHVQNEEEFFSGFMDTAIDLFASEVPVFFARGNHETRGAFSINFPDYFPTNNGKLYYTFKEGPVYFIILDCGEDKPDSDIEYFGLAHFDEYRTKQQEWLKEVMRSDEFINSPFKVVILHIPPNGTWHGAIDLRNKFLPVLNENGIDVMLCGHTHNFKYITPEQNSIADFPILINDDEAYLLLQATAKNLTIEQKDLKGKRLNRFEF